MTEFYKSIPPEIVDKLREYGKLYSEDSVIAIEKTRSLSGCFLFYLAPEGEDFWWKHKYNDTFPRWSEGLNRFID